MRRLPPLNSLRAFEAAARLGNMSAAARELCVTHGAISKQIRSLETWLQAKLLERRPSGLVLTHAGILYFDAVAASLDALAKASGSIGAAPQAETLRITAPPAFTARWLVPRLSRFSKRSPQVDISLDTSRDSVQACLRASDVVIRRGPPRWEGVVCDLFLEEFITPVCHPRLLPTGRRKTFDLAQHTWLHTDARGSDWQTWLKAAGCADMRPRHSLHFDHSSLTIDAALNAMGVAMAPLAMVQEDLHSGSLVAPLAHCVVPTPGYHALCGPGRAEDRRIATFFAWLRREGAATGHDLGPIAAPAA